MWRGREFINKRIFNFKWFGECHDPSLTSQSWRGGVSHRGGGGEALTHPFSMPEPSLPGPGRLRPFSREVLEEKSGIQHPSLPSLPQRGWVPDEAFIHSAIFIQFSAGRGWPPFPCSCPFHLRALCPLLRGGPGAQRPGLEEKQGSWSLRVSAALPCSGEEGRGVGQGHSSPDLRAPSCPQLGMQGSGGWECPPASAAGEPQGSDSQGSAREAAQSKGFWKRK